MFNIINSKLNRILYIWQCFRCLKLFSSIWWMNWFFFDFIFFFARFLPFANNRRICFNDFWATNSIQFFYYSMLGMIRFLMVAFFLLFRRKRKTTWIFLSKNTNSWSIESSDDDTTNLYSNSFLFTFYSKTICWMHAYVSVSVCLCFWFRFQGNIRQ